jgi:2-C-methyl-D-erythritol 4-phosphate cytidylyltransferase/2-C-methyl-D-erythritol 2,4-cyclodiphosphate synthase
MVTLANKTFKNVALIMAAGKGMRLGGAVPKQFLPFRNNTMLAQAINAFLHHPRVDAVRVVIGKGDEQLYADCTASFTSPKLLAPVMGGQERSHSVWNGLNSLAEYLPQNVLIHDGARPFVDQPLISRVLDELENYKGVIPGIAVVDTLKRCSEGMIEKTVDRSHLYKAQTPQGFHYSTLVAAHQNCENSLNFTDDAGLLEKQGIPVRIVPGSPENIKITFLEDIQKMTSFSLNIDVRTGHGIDVHALGSGEGVTLLGVFIPADFSLIGHSDADVGLHSLTDALLGTIADGDIGQHFNPKDNQWKGCDSAVFLKDAVRRVHEKRGRINHVDVTIMGERPKIGAFRSQMIARLAEILAIDPSRVSVKATTTEKLGFIGREEGLAAFATATVVF